MPPKKRKENEETSEPDAKKSKSENGSEDIEKTSLSSEPATEKSVCAETSQVKKTEEKLKVRKILSCCENYQRYGLQFFESEFSY